jgi:gluconolactonase
MADLELLASGYQSVEGPTVDDEGGLYFSNVLGGGVWRRDASGALDLVVPKRKGVGGICLHRDGGIVVSGRDLSHVKDGQSRVIFGREHYEAAGLPANSTFNDIHADDQGRIFAAMVDAQGDAMGGRLAGKLILVTEPGKAKILYDVPAGNNGMALDWGQQRLFHSATYASEVVVSDKVGEADYRIVRRLSTTAVGGGADGLVLDEEGCFWAAFYKGGCVARFSPEGELLQRIEMPSVGVTSLCFAGADGRDLIIVTEDNTEKPELEGCVWRTRVDVRGAPVGVAAI